MGSYTIYYAQMALKRGIRGIRDHSKFNTDPFRSSSDLRREEQQVEGSSSNRYYLSRGARVGECCDLLLVTNAQVGGGSSLK